MDYNEDSHRQIARCRCPTHDLHRKTRNQFYTGSFKFIGGFVVLKIRTYKWGNKKEIVLLGLGGDGREIEWRRKWAKMEVWDGNRLEGIGDEDADTVKVSIGKAFFDKVDTGEAKVQVEDLMVAMWV
ncbi:unnamed protein product [Lactuca saligna]|uniref:Uncharacterized protein n=1 Tax=Lactuca saligna TaxID=75948 RepID=A0AA35USR5_LACSI|nr:unnamed protein product [Lactuca saligna]